MALEKNVFVVGEAIKVQITSDNSKCRRPITGYTLKLQRNIQATGEVAGEGEIVKMQNWN